MVPHHLVIWMPPYDHSLTQTFTKLILDHIQPNGKDMGSIDFQIKQGFTDVGHN